MRAAPAHEWKDRPVIKEHSPMAGAARAPAVDAWQFYHVRRTNSAAIGVWCLVGSGMGTAWCSMAEYRGRRRRRVDSGGGERLPLESVIETRHRETRRRSAPNRPPGRGRVRCPSTGSCVVACRNDARASGDRSDHGMRSKARARSSGAARILRSVRSALAHRRPHRSCLHPGGTRLRSARFRARGKLVLD